MDFADVLRRVDVYTVDAGHHHARAGWINFDCPFCGRGTRKGHMGYNLAGRYVNCWRCGRKSIVDTLIELGIPPREAKEIFGGLAIDLDWVKPVRENLKLPKGGPLKNVHKRYLRSRGFDPDEIVRLWGVQGIGLHATLAWRILIPIHLGDEIVSWTTRSISKGDRMRYRSASAGEESVNHKELLYGEQYARHSVIVNEGPLDVWAVGPGAVGTLGIGFTRAQVLRLSKYPIRAICFDKGRQAQERARQLCDLLEVFPGDTFNVQLESGDDPASADLAEIDQLRKEFL